MKYYIYFDIYINSKSPLSQTIRFPLKYWMNMEIFRHIRKYLRVAVTLFETKVFKISIHFHENYHGHGIPPVWKRIKRQTFTGKLSAGTRVARIRALNSPPFRLLDTRFDESSSWRGWLSREQRSRPVYLTRASDLERKKRNSGRVLFFYKRWAATNFYLGLSGHSVFIYERGCVSRLRNVAGFRLFFTREPWYHGCVCVCVCVFSLFFFLGFYAPEKITFQHRGKDYFSRIELPLELRGQFMPTTLATRSRGGGVSIFARRDTPWPAPAFRFDPYARIIAANDEARGDLFFFTRIISFVSKKFHSQRWIFSIRFLIATRYMPFKGYFASFVQFYTQTWCT